MSFLDNLENSLKSLENGSEKEDAGREHGRRAAERAAQAARAPWADQLKKSSFTEKLLRAAVLEGHQLRLKVYFTWIGDTLRFEAREKRLELRPALEGVNAVFLVDKQETGSRLLDLQGDPAALIREWLGAAG